MRPLAVVGGVLCLFSSLVAREAAAQCVVDYVAELDPPIGALSGSSKVKSKGTFECGILRGKVCGSGVADGSCLASTVSSWVVSCDGDCTADYGNTPASVSCSGAVVWEGRVEGQCLSGACVLEGLSADGATRTRSVAVSDPRMLPDSVDGCGLGGPGVSQVHFVGATSYPLPAE